MALRLEVGKSLRKSNNAFANHIEEGREEVCLEKGVTKTGKPYGAERAHPAGGSGNGRIKTKYLQGRASYEPRVSFRAQQGGGEDRAKSIARRRKSSGGREEESGIQKSTGGKGAAAISLEYTTRPADANFIPDQKKSRPINQ